MNIPVPSSQGGVPRRRFVGVLAGGVTFVTGLLGGARLASAHDERVTLVAARLGREFGVERYLLRYSGRGTNTTRVVAQLLAGQSDVLGDFSKTRHRTIKTTVNRKDGEIYKHARRTPVSVETQLTFGAETISTRTTGSNGVTHVTYNDHYVGSATVRPEQQSVAPELATFLTAHGNLVHISEAVGLDIDRGLPELPPEPEGCCCADAIACGPDSASCWDFEATRAYACEVSQQCTRNNCSNSLCWGCCQDSVSACSCVCVPNTDFFCECYSYGYTCSCLRYCI